MRTVASETTKVRYRDGNFSFPVPVSWWCFGATRRGPENGLGGQAPRMLVKVLTKLLYLDSLKDCFENVLKVNLILFESKFYEQNIFECLEILIV